MIGAAEAISAASSAVSNTTTMATGATSAFSAGAATGSEAAAATTPFADLYSDAVGQVNQLETNARQTIDGLMNGSGVDVHQAMIATEKVSMAFEMALSVRNKAVQAYQSVMGMQF